MVQSPFTMIISSDLVLAALTMKVQDHGRGHSRRILCPSCRIRTKLYTLKDGRRKCSACGKKFDYKKKTDSMKIKQYADVLLCFCFDFSAQQTSTMTGYRYRLVATNYDHFRVLLASQNLTPETIVLLMTVEKRNRESHDSAFLRRSTDKLGSGGIQAGDAPVFGVKFLKGGKAFIEPLQDDQEIFHFDRICNDEGEGAKGRFAAYAGFIRQGKFQRFTDNKKLWDGAEQLWA